MARNLVLGVLVAAAAFGCTTTSTKSPADARAETNSLTSSRVVQENCARDTGSRIQRPADKPCSVQPGVTYTNEQLDQTGRLDVGEALKYLDPRLY